MWMMFRQCANIIDHYRFMPLDLFDSLAITYLICSGLSPDNQSMIDSEDLYENIM